MKIKRKILVIALAVLFTLAVRGWNTYQAQKVETGKDGESLYWMHSQWKSLWTQINFKAQTDTATFKSALDSISRFYVRFDQAFRSQSPLDSMIYQAAIGDTLQLDSLQYDLLELSLQFHRETLGRIHPGISNLIKAYGLEYGQERRVPSDSVLELAKKDLQTLPFRLIQSHQILVEKESQHIALGAFSKGYAIEWSRQLLINMGIKNFWLEIGGDLAISGHSKEGRPWTAGIQNPFQDQGLIGDIQFQSDSIFNSLATSGNYRQIFEDSNGVKHHHILDPLTARSVRGRASVSVLAKDALQADLWATAFFILPRDEILSILKKRSDLAVLMVFSDSTRWKSDHFSLYTEYKSAQSFLETIPSILESK